MITYLIGKITERQPTHILLENNGIGYFIKISLYTFEKLNNQADTKIYTYLQVKEDGFTLFGFSDKVEKQLFEALISVSGVGGNTALAILSSLIPTELQLVLATQNTARLKQVKGVGEKTAARILLELKDKFSEMPIGTTVIHSTIRTEALTALVNLGFPKNQVEKKVDALLAEKNQSIGLEEIIKNILKGG